MPSTSKFASTVIGTDELTWVCQMSTAAWKAAWASGVNPLYVTVKVEDWVDTPGRAGGGVIFDCSVIPLSRRVTRSPGILCTAKLGGPVPCAAAIYAEDMYVERSFSEETASHIRGLRPWITNEYQHNGLRVDGDRILSHLLDLARGRI